MVFPVVMYGCESWTIKKTERRRIDAFELWCWRRLLRVPWTVRRFSQSILKEISPWCSLEELMLKLKLQYFGHLMWRADSFKDPDAGKDWGQEEKGTTEDAMVGWHHQLDGHGFGWTLGDGDGQGGLVCYGSWDCKELDMTERLNWWWTDIFIWFISKLFLYSVWDSLNNNIRPFIIVPEIPDFQFNFFIFSCFSDSVPFSHLLIFFPSERFLGYKQVIWGYILDS